MNENSDAVKVHIKNTRAELAEQEKKKHAEKIHEKKEKPLEKMNKSELLKKVKQLQEEFKNSHDLYLRSQADIENLRKRTKKEKEEWIKYSNETLIKEILPVMDNLEKAISHSQDENTLHALKEGVEFTFKGLKDALAKSGMEEVKALEVPFDPCFHQAVSEQEDENMEAGMTLKELQKGYTLHQRLIRPAMVVVSKGKPGNTTVHDNDNSPFQRVCEKE